MSSTSISWSHAKGLSREDKKKEKKNNYEKKQTRELTISSSGKAAVNLLLVVGQGPIKYK